MKSGKTELFVGVFVLAGLLLLGGLIVFFGSVISLGRERYEVKATFTNIYGMVPGTPVRHLGIDVGALKETGFTEKGDEVLLILSIRHDHDIPDNATLTVRPSGILGDYYLEFSGGTPEASPFPKDGTATVKGRPMLSIDEVVSQFVEFSSKLQQNMGKFANNINDLAGSLNQLLSDEELRKNLKDTAAEAPEAVKAFRNMAERITKLGDETHGLVNRLQKLSEKLDSQLTHQGENLDKVSAGLLSNTKAVNQTLASLDEILTRFNEGKGTIGALVAKDDVHEKLVKTIDQMNETLVELRKTLEAIRRRWGN